jgi:hypothetical protein
MLLYDVPINYLAVFIAALVYFILGAIWYAPFAFGHRWYKHEQGKIEEHKISHQIGSYFCEFLLDLIIAFVLAFFIEFSQAEDYIDGFIVALWIWVGFVATTHFSAVLWSRKSVKSFFIHATFILIGLLLMSVPILYLS